MTDERSISMNQFQTVVEEFQSNLSKVVDGILGLNEKMDAEFKLVKHQIGDLQEQVFELRHDTNQLKEGMAELRNELRHETGQLKEQIGLLHEGQTEIKLSLQTKTDREELANLERRVTRLENKVA
jgi:chromosome segregation ATPase